MFAQIEDQLINLKSDYERLIQYSSNNLLNIEQMFNELKVIKCNNETLVYTNLPSFNKMALVSNIADNICTELCELCFSLNKLEKERKEVIELTVSDVLNDIITNIEQESIPIKKKSKKHKKTKLPVIDEDMAFLSEQIEMNKKMKESIQEEENKQELINKEVSKLYFYSQITQKKEYTETLIKEQFKITNYICESPIGCKFYSKGDKFEQHKKIEALKIRKQIFNVRNNDIIPPDIASYEHKLLSIQYKALEKNYLLMNTIISSIYFNYICSEPLYDVINIDNCYYQFNHRLSKNTLKVNTLKLHSMYFTIESFRERKLVKIVDFELVGNDIVNQGPTITILLEQIL